MTGWGDLLRQARERCGLTQAALAARAAGCSVELLSLYERGTRHPGRRTFLRLLHELGLDRTAKNAILAAAARQPLPTGVLERIEDQHASLARLQREIAGYPWPCLLMNDRSEIVCWNAPAEWVAEYDFARDLPHLYQRNLVRIAVMPHFRTRVQNWRHVVTAMIGLLKGGGLGINKPETTSQYLASLATYLYQTDATAFAELADLWANEPAREDAARLAFSVVWQTQVEPWQAVLRFDCLLSPWSYFDGVSALDWQPADAATWAWLNERAAGSAVQAEMQVAPPDAADSPPAEATAQGGAIDLGWRRLLRDAREGTGMTRKRLAKAAGISIGAVEAYELGTRTPSERVVLALAKALELDGATTNLILEGLDQEQQPSEWARLVANKPRLTGIYDHLAADKYRRSSRNRLHEHVAGHTWPCLVVDETCRIIAANRPLARVLGRNLLQARPDTPARNLLHVILSRFSRDHIANWDEVVSAVVPSTLKQALPDPTSEKLPPWLQQVLAELHREDPELLPRLAALWRATPQETPTSRVAVPLIWRRDGEALAFTCVLSRWSSLEDLWALDWHPTDGATWAWLEAAAGGGSRTAVGVAG